ncbi:hypothetical protein ACFPIJ_54380 [Dactylosporangium cerinum]|uniref:Integral membrane protein n=1 Tax=Dactylosporangium cerinum TaxID=1434730 RepID=A0ABV9WFL8_9ACTN
MIAVVNAWLGVASAGYPLRAEATVFVAVFGVPALVAAVAAWASRAWWDGGPVFHIGRLPIVIAAGVMLWTASALLAALLAQVSSGHTITGPVLVSFGPLWLLLCVVNLVIGVRVAGYGVLEELLTLLVNAAGPITVAVAVWRLRAAPSSTGRLTRITQNRSVASWQHRCFTFGQYGAPDRQAPLHYALARSRQT